MSALEASVTLEDVFAVVEAKRVPLAPELAGYLTLEIADGADAGGGDVDPRTVFVSEEGIVALVRPKSNPAVGDAETSVRHILAKLLEASGSATPALGVAAKRKTPSGMPALVEELEAALIPVNRAAGRRALARLAREVKRVTMGVGRNAPSRPSANVGPSSSRGVVAARRDSDEAAVAADIARPRVFDDEAATAKRPSQLADAGSPGDAPQIVGVEARRARPIPAQGLTPPPAPGLGARPADVAARPAGGLPPPPTRNPSVPVAPPRRRRDVGSGPGIPVAAEARPGSAPEKLLEDDEVENLLASFEVKAVGDREMSRDLKAIAGLDPTPAPPDATSIAELTKDVGKGLPRSVAETGTADESGASAAMPGETSAEGDPVAELLALADASGPLAPPLPPPGFGRGHRVDADPAAPPAPLGFAMAPSAGPPPVHPAPVAAPPPLAAAAPPGAATFGGPPVAPLPAPPAPPFTPRDDAGRRPSAPREPARPAAPPRPQSSPSARAVPAAAASVRDRAVDMPTGPGTSRKRDVSGRQPRAPKTAFALLLLTLMALVGVAGFIWWKAPHVFTGRKKAPLPMPVASAPVAPPKCTVALVLTDVPTGAEILLRVGQTPVDVERMPMGTRLELVGTAEGYAPRRAVIKADAPWDTGPDGKPRIEVPMQLDPSKAKPGATDPWPAAEPGSEVGGTGKPGTVHVVSNVRGAEVWLLAGLGPEARIEQLDCKSDIDVLLAGQPASLRKRLHVTEKEIQAAAADAQGNKVVSVSAK